MRRSRDRGPASGEQVDSRGSVTVPERVWRLNLHTPAGLPHRSVLVEALQNSSTQTAELGHRQEEFLSSAWTQTGPGLLDVREAAVAQPLAVIGGDVNAASERADCGCGCRCICERRSGTE